MKSIKDSMYYIIFLLRMDISDVNAIIAEILNLKNLGIVLSEDLNTDRIASEYENIAYQSTVEAIRVKLGQEYQKRTEIISKVRDLRKILNEEKTVF